MKKLTLLSISVLFSAITIQVNAQQNITKYIKCYFTQPVDATLSTTGITSVYCNNTIFDTLAAYINKAKYTIDIAQYEWETLTTTDPIQTAITAASKRGVKIRYIEDYSYSTKNTGVMAMPKTIPFLISPKQSTTSCKTSNGSEEYNIMHNKFVIIDEYNTDTTGVYVWTGSPDWDDAMSSCDYNNVIVFQSKVLARAYTNEFNIMWGDTTHGGAADSTKALFGSCKPNSGTHIFHIGGSEVELYFSPSDSVNNHIVKTIGTATVDEYCGMFTFTETTDASDIVTQHTSPISATAYVILDNYSSGTYAPYTTTFPNALKTDFAGFVSSSCLYHNKYLIVNPSAPCDDPKVLTGSHNWTSSADAENDENTVIVHNDTIANEYLQAFGGDFKTIGKASVVPPKNPCPGPTGVNAVENSESQLNIYPNPYKGSINISYTLTQDNKVTMCIYNIMGEKVATLVNGNSLEVGQHTFQFTGTTAGVYILQVTQGDHIYTKKLVQVQ